MPKKIDSIEVRFWRKVVRGEGDACWLWAASTDTGGYGHLSDGRGKLVRSNRLSWELHFGPIPDGLCVLHRCDVRTCVRPDHLFLGTRADNNADKMAKGRHGCVRGERCHASKLTAEKVREIRKDPRSQQAIANDYGVNQVMVSKIKRGVSWKHV